MQGFIVSPNGKKTPLTIGSKASNLLKLIQHKVNVPRFHVCTWEAYERYLAGDDTLTDTLRNELNRYLDPLKLYSVRSSANLEDRLDNSFAGQFTSVLNVQGVDQVIEAIRSIWDTTRSSSVQSYLDRMKISSHELLMGVIIQEMVQPEAAGVALSRNPVTGAHEIIVEAVKGLGDELVQNGVTPYRWISKADTWLEKPENGDIPLKVAEEVVSQTLQIAEKLKAHVDLEWAWDGEVLHWLQVREITTINQHNMYSNYLSKEKIPGMIKPLVWSINIPLVNTIFADLLNEMFGDTGITPQMLSKSFYYRVYFNMGAFARVFTKLGLPAESIEMMSGAVPMNKMKLRPTLQIVGKLPRIIRFSLDKWLFHRKLVRARPELDQRIRAVPWQDADKMSIQELFKTLDDFYSLMQELSYYNVLCPIMGVMHRNMFDKSLKKLGVEPSRYDFHEGIPEVDDFNPNIMLNELHAEFKGLDPVLQEKIRAAGFNKMMKMPDLEGFQKGIRNFIDKFGCLSDNSNDFSIARWRDKPDMIMDLILDYEGEPDAGKEKVKFSDLKLNPIMWLRMNTLNERVKIFNLLREQYSYFYTYSYGIFREIYLAVGKHLEKQGLLDSHSDIFYLSDMEVRQLAAEGQIPGVDHKQNIKRHKDDFERFKDINLPTVIFGDEAPPIPEESSTLLNGLSTSIGHYTGKVKVVQGIEEFGKVQDGDVLVIPYSDVGWSPLFAKAGAVVSESGGLLSHSSIIAREYGIPAVVSVNGAMSLRDDMSVTVDGHKGMVIIHES